MIYRLVKWWVKLAHGMYFRKNFRQLNVASLALNGRGKLFAANHPNSFVDPISLAINVPYPIHFLVRGDALAGPLGSFLKKYLKLLPVWREREGRDNLKSNYTTFESCLEIWRKGGAVIIFSEGLCVNEWRLRPLPKGTARLAQSAWEKGLELDIIPTAFNYQHFSGPSKFMSTTTLPPINYKDVFNHQPQPALAQKKFNELLKSALEKEVWLAQNETQAAENLPQTVKNTLLRKFLRLITLLLHGIYYWPIRNFIRKKAGHTVHFDAALFGVLMLSYPLFLGLIWVVLCWFGIDYAFFYTMLWPLVAWLYARS